MKGQLSIFDMLYPDAINPLQEVARHASPMWTTSRKELIDLAGTEPDIKVWTEAVRHEYCPYGLAGHYSHSGERNKLTGYEMRTNEITVEYVDCEGHECKIIRSWKDFAREIMDLIWRGEYKEKDT